MTAQALSAIAGILLSLVFEYVPGASGWYGSLTGVQKRLVMAVLVIAAAAGSFALACAGRDVGVLCTTDGAWGLAEAAVLALVVNQTTYKLTKRPE